MFGIPKSFFDETVKLASKGREKRAYFVANTPLAHRSLDFLLKNKGLLLAAGAGGVGLQQLKQMQKDRDMGAYLRAQSMGRPGGL